MLIMMKNIIIKGIAGGFVFFFLGWFVYGFLLYDYMSTMSNPDALAITRAEDDMVWWALILGNIAFGVLLGYVLIKSGAKGWLNHAKVGIILGLLYSLTYDMMTYSMYDLGNLSMMILDIVVMTVMTAVISVVVSFVGNEQA